MNDVTYGTRFISLSSNRHPPVLSDLIDSALVVSMLEESIRCCLTAAAERDGVVLSVEQIQRFSREAANNAACPLLLMETK